MKAAATMAMVLTLMGCDGPSAPDPAVCRDFIHRICINPVCAETSVLKADAGAACDAILQARTGCDSETFKFTTPSRERFLTCRAPLLNAGDTVEVHPACGDVTQSFEQCPDVVRMLRGIP